MLSFDAGLIEGLDSSLRTVCLRGAEPMDPLIWTAWNNGSWSPTGAGYGLSVPRGDRDRCFDRQWSSVVLELPGDDGIVSIDVSVAKASFWRACPELISKDIGQWLLRRQLAPWPKRQPPQFSVHPGGPARFRVVAVRA